MAQQLSKYNTTNNSTVLPNQQQPAYKQLFLAMIPHLQLIVPILYRNLRKFKKQGQLAQLQAFINLIKSQSQQLNQPIFEGQKVEPKQSFSSSDQSAENKSVPPRQSQGVASVANQRPEIGQLLQQLKTLQGDLNFKRQLISKLKHRNDSLRDEARTKECQLRFQLSGLRRELVEQRGRNEQLKSKLERLEQHPTKQKQRPAKGHPSTRASLKTKLTLSAELQKKLQSNYVTPMKKKTSIEKGKSGQRRRPKSEYRMFRSEQCYQSDKQEG